MKSLFERTSSNWVRYSEYEWKAAADGTMYLAPTKTAQPSIYDPLAEYQSIVLDAISIGRMEAQNKNDKEIQKAIQQFALKYGLLGLMTALPTTPNFMDYEAVYLPKTISLRKKPCPRKSIWICSSPLISRKWSSVAWSPCGISTMTAL